MRVVWIGMGVCWCLSDTAAPLRSRLICCKWRMTHQPRPRASETYTGGHHHQVQALGSNTPVRRFITNDTPQERRFPKCQGSYNSSYSRLKKLAQYSHHCFRLSYYTKKGRPVGLPTLCFGGFTCNQLALNFIDEPSITK